MGSTKERRRDLHALNEDGMLVCNPRDREAAHRAQVEAIATEDPKSVTCRKCRAGMKGTVTSVTPSITAPARWRAPSALPHKPSPWRPLESSFAAARA